MQRALCKIRCKGKAAQQLKHRLTSQLFHAKQCLPISPSIYSFSTVNQMAYIAERFGTHAKIHIDSILTVLYYLNKQSYWQVYSQVVYTK